MKHNLCLNVWLLLAFSKQMRDIMVKHNHNIKRASNLCSRSVVSFANLNASFYVAFNNFTLSKRLFRQLRRCGQQWLRQYPNRNNKWSCSCSTRQRSLLKSSKLNSDIFVKSTCAVFIFTRKVSVLLLVRVG